MTGRSKVCQVLSLTLALAPGLGAATARRGWSLTPAIKVRGALSEGCPRTYSRAPRAARATQLKSLTRNFTTFPAAKDLSNHPVRIRGRIGCGVTAPSSSRLLHAPWHSPSYSPRLETAEDLTDLRPSRGGADGEATEVDNSAIANEWKVEQSRAIPYSPTQFLKPSFLP